MKPTELLDYALGRLDDARREQLELEIARDSSLAERVSRLVRNLDRLLNDGEENRVPVARPDSSRQQQSGCLPDSDQA
jgi:anti-sigma factor RsiW